MVKQDKVAQYECLGDWLPCTLGWTLGIFMIFSAHVGMQQVGAGVVLKHTFVVTMVRNERQVLPRMLDSVRRHLEHPSWIMVCDTGSTDGTWEWLETQHVLRVQHAWQDFATNRNACLQAVTWFIANRTTDPQAYHVLFLDADHTVTLSAQHARIAPQADLNMIDIADGGWTNRLPYLMSWRAARHCRYVGVTHEYLDCEGVANVTRQVYHGLRVNHGADGGNRGTKFSRDLALLTRALNQSDVSAQLKRRYAFYLARTHEDMGNCTLALPWYEQRARWGGWIQEAFFAQYRAALCMARLNYTRAQQHEAMVQATRMLPTRAEPYYYLALEFRQHGDWAKCVYHATRGAQQLGHDTSQLLFADRAIYAWMLLDELALCLYYARLPALAQTQWRALLQEPSLDATQRARLVENLKFVAG